LPVYLFSPSILIALLDYLAKSAVAGIASEDKTGAIKEIKVIHLQDTCEALAEIEALSYIGVLVVQTRAAQFWIVPLSVAQNILRGREGKACRVEDLRYAGLAGKVGLGTAVRCSAEGDTGNAVWTQSYIWSRCRFSRIGIAIFLDLALIANRTTAGLPRSRGSN